MSRSRGLSTALGGLLLAATCGCPSAASGPLSAVAAEGWQRDLDVLVRTLETRHAAPYRKQSRAQLEARAATLRAELPSASTARRTVELARLAASVGDGHTELWLTQPRTGFHQYPLGLYFFGDELRVVAAAPSEAETLGGKVLAIDGHPLADCIAAVTPLISRDNDQEILHAAPTYLTVAEVLASVGVAASEATATYRLAFDDGRVVERLLRPVAEAEYMAEGWRNVRELAGAQPPLYLSRRGESYWQVALPDGTLYVHVARCDDQDGRPSLRRFAGEVAAQLRLHPPGRVVVDLRLNTGGNFHKTEPLVDALREGKRGAPVLVLTGRRTFSAATVTAILLQRRTGARLVGEPGRTMPNLTFNDEAFELPSTGLRVTYTQALHRPAPELGESDRLPVDVPVTMTFDDYRAGRDPVLEAATRPDVPPAS